MIDKQKCFEAAYVVGGKICLWLWWKMYKKPPNQWMQPATEPERSTGNLINGSSLRMHPLCDSCYQLIQLYQATPASGGHPQRRSFGDGWRYLLRTPASDVPNKTSSMWVFKNTDWWVRMQKAMRGKGIPSSLNRNWGPNFCFGLRHFVCIRYQDMIDTTTWLSMAFLFYQRSNIIEMHLKW